MSGVTGARLPIADIDPLAVGEPGSYHDDRVTVLRGRPVDASSAVVRTEHFCVRRTGRRVQLSHWLRPDELDNDLAGLLANELFTPGWLSGVDIFERVFTGVVMSTVDDPEQAWALFYRNTLRRIGEPEHTGEHATISGIAPVYERALELIGPGHVLDVGSCFGFLALRLAARPRTTVLASDVSQGSMRLLERMAQLLGLPVQTTVCDAARVPLPDRSVDTVSVLHLLEHLEPAHGLAVLREALRLARRRVVVAVPFEAEPNAAYGHIRTFDLDVLTDLGSATGRPYQAAEHHGGWLVLDPG